VTNTLVVVGAHAAGMTLLGLIQINVERPREPDPQTRTGSPILALPQAWR